MLVHSTHIVNGLIISYISESSPVTNLSIDYQYSFIRWSPPLVPNGVIDHYRLVLTEYKDTLIDNVTVENTSYDITSLGESS